MSENTTEKGNRHENEAKDILGRVYGAGVEKVDAYSNHDPFRFVDLIAMKPGEPILFVQVKTNRFTASDKRKYHQRIQRRLPDEHAEFEVWVRVERHGWEMYAPTEDGFELVREIPVCKTSEAREQYAESVGHLSE